MKNSIDWSEVGSSGRFEDIVGVLLSTLYPQSERIDGSGGDGGRDHQLRTSDRLDLWQSKYFLKRLAESKTRKNQIKDSLQTAAGLQPNSWTLVTPMVPNPTELKWFDGLRKDYPFPLCWHGGSWLNARLAKHPEIIRFYMSANDDYVELLRDLKEEREALVDGLPAATGRIEQLAHKINAANPFYRVDFVVEDGRIVSTSLKPKYLGAERDSPIMASFMIETDSTGADASILDELQAALDWGDKVTLPSAVVRNLVIDAPHGLGGEFESAEITIGPAASESIDLALRLAVRAPDGRQLAALPAKLLSRVRAGRGLTLHGEDITGMIEARLRLDTETKNISLGITYKTASPMLPGALLPVLRFRQLAVAPNCLSFRLGDAAESASVRLPQDSTLPAEYIELVEGLERLQQAAGEAFPVPEEWSINDQREVRRGIKLLDGHRVTIGSGRVSFTMDDPSRFLQAFASSPAAAVAFTSSDSYLLSIAGHELDLGPCTFYLQRAKLDPASEEPDAFGIYHIAIIPDDDYGVEVALGALTQPPGQPPAEIV